MFTDCPASFRDPGQTSHSKASLPNTMITIMFVGCQFHDVPARQDSKHSSCCSWYACPCTGHATAAAALLQHMHVPDCYPKKQLMRSCPPGTLGLNCKCLSSHAVKHRLLFCFCITMLVATAHSRITQHNSNQCTIEPFGW